MSNYPIVTMRLLIQFHIIEYIDPKFHIVKTFFSDLDGEVSYSNFSEKNILSANYCIYVYLFSQKRHGY